MKSTLLILLTVVSFGVVAQELDLKAPRIELISGLSHMSGENASILPGTDDTHGGAYERAATDIHEVVIDTKAKRITITHVKTGTVRYDVEYTSAYQGDKSQSVKLNPSESMFMVRDDNVNMITHDYLTKTMHVILKDNQIDLFGHLQFKEEE